MSPGSQGRRDAQLARGSDPGNHGAVVVVEQLGERGVVVRERATVEHRAEWAEQTDLLGDGAGRPRVVAGQHRHPDARLAAQAQGLRDVRARRVLQREQSEELEVVLHLLASRSRPAPRGDGEHAPSPVGQGQQPVVHQR